jgi:hypothetical protein
MIIHKTILHLRPKETKTEFNKETSVLLYIHRLRPKLFREGKDLFKDTFD